MRSRSYLACLCVLSTAASPAVASDRLSSAVAGRIDRDVKTALQHLDVPGASVLVMKGGHVLFRQAYGFRDVDHRLPVRSASLFEIGSITKQFTAACILQLQEAGKLEIDRPLSDYLPGAPHAKEVTLRQLLTHTSGLHDYLAGPDDEIDPLVVHPIAYNDLIARVAPLPLDFKAGSRWSYSNTGYLLLGRVIEIVSGDSYRTYLQDHVLTPLGMTHTYTVAEENQLPEMATGYRRKGGRRASAPPIDATWAGAAGFLVSTPSDLAKWDVALRHGRVIPPALYREMTTSSTTTEGASTDYGLGLFLTPAYGEPRIGHTGGSNGFTTADEYFPRQDLRIIAFTNLAGDAAEAGETLTNIIFADLHPAIAAEDSRPAPGEDAKITQTVRESFQELRAGTGYAQFSARLRGKLAAGSGAKFVTSLGPYGPPSAAIFKGVRRDSSGVWRDYVLKFGPGVWIPFTVRLGPDGSVESFSVG